jgi:hypothetical protein
VEERSQDVHRRNVDVNSGNSRSGRGWDEARVSDRAGGDTSQGDAAA